MLKMSLAVASTAAILSASTTMCYKKDHLDPSTIESIALDGGKCDGKLSVIQMKKNGYVVDSMKLQNGTDGLNYIYIFEKKSHEVSKDGVNSVTNEQLTAQIKEIEKNKKLQKVTQNDTLMLEEGKKVYETTCKSCHGNGSISAYNTAKPLKQMSLEEMELSIRDYNNGSKDNGMAILMTPYANMVTKKEIKSIYIYLKTLK